LPTFWKNPQRSADPGRCETVGWHAVGFVFHAEQVVIEKLPTQNRTEDGGQRGGGDGERKFPL
jgi:hypothetical protein